MRLCMITIEEKKRLAEWIGGTVDFYNLKKDGYPQYFRKSDNDDWIEFDEGTLELGGADLMELIRKSDYAMLMGLYFYHHRYEPQAGYITRARAWFQNPKNALVILKGILKGIG